MSPLPSMASRPESDFSSYLFRVVSALLGTILLFWLFHRAMITAMTYGEIARGLHYENDTLDMRSLSIDDLYCYPIDSLIIVPAPAMHDLDYFPHRVLVLGQKCTGCLHVCDYGGCTGHAPISRSSTPRGSTVSVRHANTHPRSKPPYSHARRVKQHKLQRSRSLTDIQSSGTLAPSPLRYCAAYDEAGVPIPARVGPVSGLCVAEMHLINAVAL
jgi:hypothetical protein